MRQWKSFSCIILSMKKNIWQYHAISLVMIMISWWWMVELSVVAMPRDLLIKPFISTFNLSPSRLSVNSNFKGLSLIYGHHRGRSKVALIHRMWQLNVIEAVLLSHLVIDEALSNQGPQLSHFLYVLHSAFIDKWINFFAVPKVWSKTVFPLKF